MVHTINIKSDINVKNIHSTENVNVDGSITTNNLTVNGPFSFKSAIQDPTRFSDNVTIDGDLDVGGVFSFKKAAFDTDVKFNENVEITKNTSIKGNLLVDGEFSFKNAVFSQPTTFNENITANKNIYSKTGITTDGHSTFKGATFRSKVTFDDDIETYGKISASEIETDAFSFKNAVFSQPTTFKSDVSAEGNLDITGKIKAKTIEAENISFDNAIFDKPVSFTETVDANQINVQRLEAQERIVTHGDIYASGEITSKDGIFYNLMSIGQSNLKDDVFIDGELDVKRDSHVKGNMVINGNVNTYKDMFISGDMRADTLTTRNNVDVQGDAIFRKDVQIDGKVIVSGGTSGGTSFDNISVSGTASIEHLVVETDFTCQDVLCRDIKQVSDERLKNTVTPLDPKECIENVKKMNPVSFIWNGTEDKDIGFIAQQIKEIYPELVNESKGFLNVKYSNIVSILVSCIQHQQKEIEELKSVLYKE